MGNITISFNLAAITVLVPTISADLNKPALLVSKIISFYLIPYGIGALIYAPLTRYVSYQAILIGAMAVYGVLSFFCGIVHSFEYILWSQIAIGIAAASSTPLSLMIIGALFEKRIRGRLVGTYFSSSFFASLVGVFLSGFLHWRWLFILPAVLAIGTAICLLLFSKNILNRVHKAEVNYFKIFSRQTVRNVFIFIFCISFLYHGVFKWYGIYLNREYGLDKFVISVFLMLTTACGFLGQLAGGYLTDKRGRVFTCITGTVTLAAGTMLLFGHYPLTILGAVLSVIAVGWTVCHNSISTILTDFSDGDRPMIASLNSSVRFISGGAGFSLSSLFVERSFGLTFLVIGICMLALTAAIKNVFVNHY